MNKYYIVFSCSDRYGNRDIRTSVEEAPNLTEARMKDWVEWFNYEHDGCLDATIINVIKLDE